jgi:peptidoglycan hydrolase-like protein with peptidoglycan-binding domain
VKLDAVVYAEHLFLARARGGGTLRWGSRNTGAVRALQRRLSALGYATEADGQWGADTERQFRAFQHAQGLKTDGILGPRSLTALLKAKPRDPNAADPSITAIAKVVAPGMQAQGTSTTGLGRIRAQQRGGGSAASSSSGGGRGRGSQSAGTAAAPKGPHGGAIDPVTGAETATSSTGPISSTDPNHPSAQAKALKRGQGAAPAQPQNNNPAFNALHPREGGKFAKKGDSGQQIGDVQMALNQVGGAKLKQDGQFGPKTEGAVKRFQKANGLVVDGIVGTQTSGAIRRKLNALQQTLGSEQRGLRAFR